MNLDVADFDIIEVLDRGGYGLVVSAIHIPTGDDVAMKFFGYTQKQPRIVEIVKEVGLMKDLNDAVGVIRLIGTFSDTPEGYVSHLVRKVYCKSYPVIVMEKLVGGCIIDRIKQRSAAPTESYLAHSFGTFIRALETVHERGYIHRDLKLENVMAVCADEASPMKVIDFGHMASLPTVGGVIIQQHVLLGTEGYFAPESLQRYEYSARTDIWQAGCILYTMLAGHPPFHFKKESRQRIVHHSYHPMEGAAWDGISAAGKDLVRRMLTKDPAARITIAEILQHPWLATTAIGNFGEHYLQRIKNLVLRHKLKMVFCANQIEEEHLYLRETFQHILPFLRHPLQSNESILHDAVRSEEFNTRLLKLKEILVAAIYDKSNREVAIGDTSEQDDDRGRTIKRRRLVHHGHIDFDTFCDVVRAANLEMLATSEVFRIFDTNSDGSVDMKEFLVTLLALRPTASEEDQIEAAELYFRMFDVDEDGAIGQNELELVVNCLLHDGTGPLLVTSDHEVNSGNVEDLFRAIDTDNDGRIDLAEFKNFFQLILQVSSANTSLTENHARMEEFSSIENAAVIPSKSGTFSFL